jgi:hypothetical protein
LYLQGRREPEEIPDHELDHVIHTVDPGVVPRQLHLAGINLHRYHVATPARDAGDGISGRMKRSHLETENEKFIGGCLAANWMELPPTPANASTTRPAGEARAACAAAMASGVAEYQPSASIRTPRSYREKRLCR